METIVTNLQSCKDDGGVEYIVFLGRAPVGLGDMVNYKYRDRLIGQRYVAFRKITRMSELERDDIQVLALPLRSKTSLWSCLEREYAMHIPSNFEITILGLSTSDYYVGEPVGDTREWGVLEYFNVEDDPYEDEYGDLPHSEKIRSRRNES